MKPLIRLLLFLAPLSVMGKRPVVQSNLPLADPFVLFENGIYYAYGTYADDGIEVFTSRNLRTWSDGGLALHKRQTTASLWFWAPEVYHIGDTYYMYYSAQERLYVATSKSPAGPFRQVGDMLHPHYSIDGTLYLEEEGKPHLFFVKNDSGNEIWAARLDSSLTRIEESTLHKIFSVSQPWEQDEAFPGAYINEGPFLLHHGETYYLTYSANPYQSQHYGIGLATAPSLDGPWEKFPGNPIFQHPDTLVGTGHHSFFYDKHGHLQMAFHAHFSSHRIHPRLCYFTRVKFKKNARGADLLQFSPKILSPKQVKE